MPRRQRSGLPGGGRADPGDLRGLFLKILYLGPYRTTSAYRTEAFRRAGHTVRSLDPVVFLPKAPGVATWAWRTGALGLGSVIESGVLAAIASDTYDLVFVDPGSLVSKSLVEKLRARSRFVVNYNLDNPYSGRDGARWRLLLGALPEYDLVITPRLSSVEAARRLGARAVRMFQCADEVCHRPRALTPDERSRYESEVAFVGTWMPGRDDFVRSLLQAGVPVSVFGTRWSRAPEYEAIRHVVREGHLEGAEYAAALLGAKVVLCMLSDGNLDLHTTRSVEAPALGLAMCAPDTPDHRELYEPDREVALWRSAEDCAAQCLRLLADDDARSEMGRAALIRAQRNGHFNENLIPRIMAQLGSG